MIQVEPCRRVFMTEVAESSVGCKEFLCLYVGLADGDGASGSVRTRSVPIGVAGVDGASRVSSRVSLPSPSAIYSLHMKHSA